MSNRASKLMRTLTTIAIGFTITPVSQYSLATGFPELAEVFLIDQQQQQVKIADLAFSAVTDSTVEQTALAVTMDYTAFNDHFLSMRPFKCIESASEWFCHLPYPYNTRSIVSASDLADLEYQLLFIKKTPTEFGIDAWNGLYYQLTLNDDGRMEGQLLEGDLNVLASPPEEDFARPIDLNEFIAADTSRRPFPKIVIIPKQP